MMDNLKCLFIEDFSDEQNSEKLRLEHSRLRTVFSLSGNLMVGLFLFALVYVALFSVQPATAVGLFLLWTGVFFAMLAAFEKMFKQIEEGI
jgi:uncharacterized membrane protein HdeD (DUF308 family)